MKNRPSLIAFTDGFPAGALERFAKRIEELDFESLWVTEFTGRDPYTTAAHLLAHTETLTIATGIANVYSHDAVIAAQNRQSLAELSGGRFVLGLGVSHPPMAEMHGLPWLPPLEKVETYLDTMERTRVDSPRPETPAPIWLAANGPRLLDLVARRLDGANTYLLPPAHTRRARQILGPDKRINVVLPCCLCEDPAAARKTARRALGIYMPLPAYQREWIKWGFEEADWAQGGSDRLIDGLVGWGDEAAIRARIAEHEAAGASHVAISAYNPAGGVEPDWKLIDALAS